MAGISQDVQNYINSANQAANDYTTTANQNTGITGYGNALKAAQQNSNQIAANQTASATNQAIQSAQQAGLSKSAAALNAGNTAASTYSNSYNQSLANQQSMAQSAQQEAMKAADVQYQNKLATAQTKLNTAIADYQRKLQRTQQIISTAMKLGSFGLNRVTGGTTGASGSLADLRKSNSEVFNNAGQDSTIISGNGLNGQLMGNDMFLSDKTEKQSAADDFFDSVNQYIYRYKPETGLDQDVHVGLVAQEAEKAQPDMVEEVSTEEGNKKAINKQKLLETVAAGIASLRKELNKGE